MPQEQWQWPIALLQCLQWHNRKSINFTIYKLPCFTVLTHKFQVFWLWFQVFPAIKMNFVFQIHCLISLESFYRMSVGWSFAFEHIPLYFPLKCFAWSKTCLKAQMARKRLLPFLKRLSTNVKEAERCVSSHLNLLWVLRNCLLWSCLRGYHIYKLVYQCIFDYFELSTFTVLTWEASIHVSIDLDLTLKQTGWP